MSQKNSEYIDVHSLVTTVQNFFLIFVNFCTLVLLNSLTFPDRRNHVLLTVDKTSSGSYYLNY